MVSGNYSYLMIIITCLYTVIGFEVFLLNSNMDLSPGTVGYTACLLSVKTHQYLLVYKI